MRIDRILIWGAVALLVIVLGGGWAIDFATAGGVSLQARISPSVLPADGFSSGRFVVRATNADGSPRAGDTIEVLRQGTGAFDRTRALTDAGGVALFLYTTSRSNKYQPAQPVPVIVTDTSLGRLIEIDKNVTISINVVDPSKLKKRS